MNSFPSGLVTFLFTDIEGSTKLWEQHHPMARDHHGGAVQHPLIVGDILYSEQRAFDLRTGRQTRDDLPQRRGCGTMAASRNSFFFRNFFHGMWDLKTNQRTQFEGIRGGCWISMIPSGGLVGINRGKHLLVFAHP